MANLTQTLVVNVIDPSNEPAYQESPPDTHYQLGATGRITFEPNAGPTLEMRIGQSATVTAFGSAENVGLPATDTGATGYPNPTPDFLLVDVPLVWASGATPVATVTSGVNPTTVTAVAVGTSTVTVTYNSAPVKMNSLSLEVGSPE